MCCHVMGSDQYEDQLFVPCTGRFHVGVLFIVRYNSGIVTVIIIV